MSGKTFLDDFNNLMLASALGLVKGWTPIRLFGMNAGVPATGTVEMWPVGTIRVLPTTAAVASLISSDAADTMTSGTGAWTVQVRGLDENYLRITETVEMNGLSAVTTTATFLRVAEVYVITAGTTETNVGNITISVGGDTQNYIEAAEGRNHSSHFTVPADHTLLVNHLKIGVGRMAGTSDIHILSQVKPFVADSAWQVVDDTYLYNGSISNEDDYAFVMTEKQELRQQIVSSVTTQAFSTWFGFLVENGSWVQK